GVFGRAVDRAVGAGTRSSARRSRASGWIRRSHASIFVSRVAAGAAPRFALGDAGVGARELVAEDGRVQLVVVVDDLFEALHVRTPLVLGLAAAEQLRARVQLGRLRAERLQQAAHAL